MEQVTLENASSWIEWSDVEGAVCSLPVCRMFLVSAVVEVVNLWLHWIAIPVDVNEGNAGGEIGIICAVDDIRSRIGV